MPNIGDAKDYCIYHACIDCGKERWVNRYDLTKQKSLRCKKCAATYRRQFIIGKKHYAWRGGHHLTSEGYKMITIEKEGDFFLPMAQGKRRYVLEHRLVMAKYLNRCLLPWETVHHKNGNITDNKLENLELFPIPHKHNGISQLQRYIKQLEAENRKLKRELTKQG